MIARELKIITMVGVLAIVFACTGKNRELTVKSPDEQVQIHIGVNNGALYYRLIWQEDQLIDSSLISLFDEVPVTIVNSESCIVDTTWHPVWGQFSEIRDHCRELVLTLDFNGKKGKLKTRVYNDGVAFRFEAEDQELDQELSFVLEHHLAVRDKLFWPAGESEPKGPLAVRDLMNSEEKPPRLAMPLVVERVNGKYLSILESDIYAADGFNAMHFAVDKKTETLISLNKGKNDGEKIITPWRVILLGETAGDMVTSTVTVNLATPNQLEDTDWIRPGKTLWDWRVHSYVAPDGFKYGINTESYKRFIDFAAEKEIEYFLIDDSWYTHASKGHFELSEKLDLQAVIEYAAEKEVELILYYDRKHGEYGDDELFPYYQSLGMKGIKYGFMGEKVEFSRYAIEKSAESKLLIDFHDGPVPFTGIRRTLPNAITREYCHAQQDSRRAFTPEAFIKMALINALQGPLDMNNGNFDIVGINSGVREKSPRIKGSYLTTVTSEVARTLIIFSGLVCIPDAPEAYLAKADLFEFIQKMPVGKWDESRVLHSKMGEYISTARRHGDEWFIGSVYNQQGGNLDIILDFLKEGKEYDVTFYEDTDETHCKTNPEEYKTRKGTVTKDEIITAKIAPGGGHCMWVRPAGI